MRNRSFLGRSYDSTKTQAAGVWSLRGVYESQKNDTWVKPALTTTNKLVSIGANPLNLSEYFSTAATINLTKIADTQTSRSSYGGIPLKLTIMAPGSRIKSDVSSTWNLSETVVGDQWKIAILAKASPSTMVRMNLYEVSSYSSIIAYSSYDNMAVSTWYEYSAIHTVTAADAAQIRVSIGSNSSTGLLWIDALQVYKIN